MNQSIDRRQFLNHTAQGAVAATAAGVALSAGTSRAAIASSERKVVIGVMGLSRGMGLAAGFTKQPDVEIKYLSDVDQDRLAAGVSKLEGADQKPKGVSDFRRILDDDSVDALICAAPNHWHAPATILACAAGKHVYVEKPCSHNPHEGELMIEAARKHKRAVQMGSQRRSGPGHIEAMKKLEDGVIGRVYLARCWYDNLRTTIGRGKAGDVPKNFDYALWQGPAPRMPFKEYELNGKRSPHYNWHWRWHWGNGELGNNGVHTLDLCRWGIGGEYPVRVTSSGGRYRYDDDQQTPDTHTVAFEFEDDRMVTWEGLSCNRHGSGFVTFYGEDGALDLDSNGGYKVYDAKNKLVEEKSGKTRGDAEHLADFLDAIRNETPMQLNAQIETGHKSTMLCHLGNIAHRSGRTLNCDPENGRIVGDDRAMKLWSREYEPGWEPKV